MASITSYSTLLQAIVDVAEDDSVEFSAYIPTGMDLAEERLFKELELPEVPTKVTGSLTQDNRMLTKPASYKYPHYFRITVSGAGRLLEKRTDDFIQDYWPTPTVTGVPKYYADSSSTEFIIAPTPDSGYSYELKATFPPTKLSVSNPTNYFVNECQDVLFAACMVEMAKFMKAWSQVTVWKAYYEAARDSWNINSKRLKRDDGQTPNSPQGPNTLAQAVK